MIGAVHESVKPIATYCTH